MTTKKIRSAEELRDVILQLENRKVIQEQLLKEQFQTVYSSLKPVNFIKNTIRAAFSSNEVKNDVFGYVANIAADFVTKPLTRDKSGNYLKKIFGQILHQGITTLMTLNSEKIIVAGESLINKLFRRNEKEDDE